MNKLFIIVVFAVYGCVGKDEIRIQDLIFDDWDRAAIKANKIDTTYTIIPQEDGSELKEFKVYDEDGKVLYESSTYNFVRYHYDTRGVLCKKEYGTSSGVDFDTITYKFNQDSMILFQKWSNRNTEYKFYFNDRCRVQKSEEFITTEQGIIPRYRTQFEYEGDLLRKVLIYRSKEGILDLEYDLYYSAKGILDSATLRTDNGHRQYWIYDSVGLIKTDGYRRFVHTTR